MKMLELTIGTRTIVLPEIELCIEYLAKEHARSILVEFPIGWKCAASQLAKALRNALNAKILVSGKPCWGICDTCILQENVDAVLHVGHVLTPNLLKVFSSNTDIRLVDYDEHYSIYSVNSTRTLIAQYAYYLPEQEVLNSLLEQLRTIVDKDNTVLAYALPYRLYCEELAQQLGLPYSLVTGCYLPPLHADKLVVVSSGYFHALTPLLLGYNNVLLLDIDRTRLIPSEDVKKEFTRRLTLKVNALMRAKEGKTACVLLSTKPGQKRIDDAEKALMELENSGISADIVIIDDLTDDILQSLACDFAVSTMCPRLGFDDLDRFSKPIINIRELQYVLHSKISELDYRKIMH